MTGAPGGAGTGMVPAVSFYFDYISPNAYLAWLRLKDLVAQGRLTLRPVPVLFAGMLERYGQLGPAEIGPKARWMVRNNLRKAALAGLPLNPPAHHPFNPLAALRLTLVADEDRCMMPVIDTLFTTIWVEGAHGGDAAALADALRHKDFPADDWLVRARAAPVKQRLRSNTESALEAGVFGVPTVIVDGELFWGYDDLPMAERRLAGNDPLDPAEARRWERGVLPSAMRRAAGGPGGDA